MTIEEIVSDIESRILQARLRPSKKCYIQMRLGTAMVLVNEIRRLTSSALPKSSGSDRPAGPEALVAEGSSGFQS